MKKKIKLFLKKLGYKISKINDDFKIVEKNNFENDLIKKIRKFTLTNEQRIWLLIQAFKTIYNNKIEGEIVECGVWKGGNLIILGELCKKYNLNKEIIAYDTFEGMTQPTEEDVNFYNKSALKNMNKYQNNKDDIHSFWAINSLENTKENITNNTTYKKFKFIKGDVVKTLDIKENLPKKISLLRLDTDFFESTKKELEVLYPLLENGGVLIIDDYGDWKGCRKAVDEYFKNKRVDFFMNDFSCRFMIKKIS